VTLEQDIQYHEDAIRYNNIMADAAYKVAKEVQTKQVQHWAWSIGRQHREHAKKHRKTLWWKKSRLEKQKQAGNLVETPTEDGLVAINDIDTIAVEETLPIEEQQRRMPERAVAEEQDGETND
jgi:hypothetical protein